MAYFNNNSYIKSAILSVVAIGIVQHIYIYEDIKQT